MHAWTVNTRDDKYTAGTVKWPMTRDEAVALICPDISERYKPYFVVQ